MELIKLLYTCYIDKYMNIIFVNIQGVAKYFPENQTFGFWH